MVSVNSVSDPKATVRLSPHVVRTVRHLRSGVAEYTRQECVVTVAGSSQFLDTITGITMGEVTAMVDQKARLVRHTSHTDPLVRFRHEGVEQLQIFLHDTLPSGAPPVALIHTGHAIESMPVVRDETDLPEPVETRIVDMAGGQMEILIEVDDVFELIEQRVNLGQYSEHRITDVGRGEFPVSPRHADVFGVVVSSRGVHGGIEHKHQILGRFGYPSGRKLIRSGQIYDSGQTEPHNFKSALAPLDDQGLVGGLSEPWLGFSELEVWCEPVRKAEAEAAMLNCSIPWAIRTYGHSPDADVMTLNPGDTPPVSDQFFSFNLFGTGVDFHDRLQASIAHVDNPRLVERLWILNQEEPASGEKRYGIAWTTYTDDADQVERSKIRELRHRAIGATRSDTCAGKAACIPLPHPHREAGFVDAIRMLSAAKPMT